MLLIGSISLFGQCVESNFSVDISACLRQNLLLQNASSGALDTEWDFCAGDLATTPIADEVLNNANFFRARSVKLIQEGDDWHGFSISSTSNILMRLDFGNNPSSVPLYTNLGNISSGLDAAYAFDIIQVEGIWHLFVANGGNKNILRYSFDQGIMMSPTLSILNTNSVLDTTTPNDIKIMKINNDFFAFITTGNSTSDSKIVRLDFGTSISNDSPLTQEIVVSGANRLRGIDIVKDCNDWYGFTISENSSTLLRLDFGTDILNSTPVTSILNTSALLNRPINIEIINEGGAYYGLISNSRIEADKAAIYRVSFGEFISNTIFTTEKLSFPELTGGIYALDLITLNSSWHIFTFNLANRNLIRLDFVNNCSANQEISTQFDPIDIFYSQSGNYDIALKITDTNGLMDYSTKSITITTDTAPAITSSSQNICLSNPINFTSTSDQTLSSQTWDFGDTNTSTDPNPSYTYAAAGEYEVTLQVQSTNGCNNFTKQTIMIYDQPVPDFTLPSGAICTNEEYTFVNNTVDNFDGNLTYEWQVDGSTVSTTRDLVYQFTTEGAKDIKLIASIPGCDIEQVENIANVNLGAVPLYTYDTNNACLDDPIIFVNQSTGVDITYLWDFDDTNTSTDSDPMHTYTSAGTYMVSLEVTNLAGCITTYEQDVVVHSMPLTDFSAELACTDRNTQLTNLTTIDNANITAWDWDFGDPSSGSDNASTDKDPSHTFSGTGNFTISLSATSDFGCETNILKAVPVLESPIVDFDVENKCVDDAFLFTDNSIPNSGGSISSYIWDINGSVYTVQDPSHTFDNSGTYMATLTIKSDNNCAVTATKTITVNPLPTVDFTLSANCANTEIMLEDKSVVDNDEVINWQWTVNGQDAGNTAIISHTFEKGNAQQVDLRIITVRGCIISTTKNVDFFELPTADFDPTPQYGAPPAEISFNNTSNNAVTYQWDFGDGTDIVTELSPSHSYPDLGVYNVKLIATSIAGCTDEIIKQVYLVDPKIDLSIDEITTFNNEESLLFTMSNKGTIPVNNLTATVTFDNEFSIEESFETNILPDETSVAQVLSFSIPNNTKVEFLCISLSTTDGVDVNTDDNIRCLNISSEFVILPPYPNPISRQRLLTLPIVGAQNDEVSIAFISASGKQFISQNILLSQSGLNNINFSLFSLKPGIYFIRVRSLKSTESFRIFVN